MSGLVKHYQNSMQGIPQLSNNWGAMINLLDAVLVNGFNHIPVISVSKSTPSAITATINLGSGHGFIDRQVVRIAGSTNGWDGDYKVLSADANSIQVECLPEQPSVANGMATCFTAPLDFEIIHQTPSGSSQPKRAYRSTDPESLGLILLVHDFCVNGASETGAKFAKVGIVSDMVDIDTIVGNQMPYDSANPNANWGWDGTYHGWAKWYYRTAQYGSATALVSDTAAPVSNNSDFCLVGDSKSICIDITTSNQASQCVYGMFEFYDNAYKGQNVALMASGSQIKVPQAQGLYANARSGFVLQNSSNLNFGSSNNNTRGLLYFDAQGLYAAQKIGEPLSITKGLQTTQNSGLDDFFVPFAVIDDLNIPRCYLPFLKLSTSNNTDAGIDINAGKFIKRYAQVQTQLISKYAITLEVE